MTLENPSLCKRSYWDRMSRFAYRTTWRDPLVVLAACRAINPRSVAYRNARRAAMAKAGAA